MSNQTFNTLVEQTVNLRNKEFRISATENTNNGTFLVGVREYSRTETYTGYSKFNGVSLPAPTKEVALALVATFAQQLGNIQFPIEQPQPQQQYAPQGQPVAQQQYAQQPQTQQQQYAQQPQQQYMPTPPPYEPQGQHGYEAHPPLNEVPQPNPFLQNVAPTPYDGNDDLPI